MKLSSLPSKDWLFCKFLSADSLKVLASLILDNPRFHNAHIVIRDKLTITPHAIFQFRRVLETFRSTLRCTNSASTLLSQLSSELSACLSKSSRGSAFQRKPTAFLFPSVFFLLHQLLAEVLTSLCKGRLTFNCFSDSGRWLLLPFSFDVKGRGTLIAVNNFLISFRPLPCSCLTISCFSSSQYLIFAHPIIKASWTGSTYASFSFLSDLSTKSNRASSKRSITFFARSFFCPGYSNSDFSVFLRASSPPLIATIRSITSRIVNSQAFLVCSSTSSSTNLLYVLSAVWVRERVTPPISL